MPGSTISAFGEPDEYQAALRADAGFDLLVTGRGEFRAQLTRIALSRIHLLAGEEALARIGFIAIPPRLVRISLPVRDDGSMCWGEISARVGEIVTHGPGQRLHERTDGPCRWRTIWFPATDLVQYGRILVGATFDVPPGVWRWRPPAKSLRFLAGLYDDAIRVSKVQPRLAAGAQAARGLEQQLIEAVVECLQGRTTDGDVTARTRQGDTMAGFEDLIRILPGQAAPTREIAAALGVSGHTLLACCKCCLGMGPQQYLRLRRMQSVYRELRDTHPGIARVSEIALRYGFTESGRFEKSYHQQFGESPSVTLQRETRG